MARICIKTTYDYILKYHDSVLKKKTKESKEDKNKRKKKSNTKHKENFQFDFFNCFIDDRCPDKP